jgi:hypothetical protein
MSNRISSLPKAFLWSVGSLVVMVLGAVGPWAKVDGVATINGTDGGRDGWVVVGAAGVAALFLALYLRRSRSWVLVLPLLAGLAGTATTVVDIDDINGIASEGSIFGVAVSAQWGIYVALAGSISLTLASVGLLVRNRRTRSLRAEAPSGA